MLCSDGISVFKSSGNKIKNRACIIGALIKQLEIIFVIGLQLWPIELCITNLPPEIRYNVQFLVVGGLWLGTVKPDMNMILKPI